MTKKILVVEDHNQIRRLIVDALKMTDSEYELEQAENGFDAFVHLSNTERLPDLILLDRIMPKKTGDELLNDIRKNDAWKNIPVMMMTAKSKSIDVVKGLGSDLGADDYLVKPFHFDEMKKRVNLILEYVSENNLEELKQKNLDRALLNAMKDNDEILSDDEMDNLANDKILEFFDESEDNFPDDEDDVLS